MTDMTPTKLNPTECEHVFSYDHERSIIYCPLCGWYWDADFETPTAQPSAVPDRCERSEHVAAMTTPTLNPDNEPDSEHMMWRHDND